MRRLPLLSLLLGAGLLGCGSTEAPSSTMTMTEPPENQLSFDTGEFDVPPGDSFECFYTSTTTDKEINVAGALGTQGPGGHHIVIYYTDTQHAPTHHPCVDAEMVAWHQIAGASPSGGEPVIQLPEGAAEKVPPGKQLVVQSHYINTTGATQKVSDSVKLQLLDDKDVKKFVNSFTVVDTGFQVPPMATGKSVSLCTVPQDLNLVLLLGHMHEMGKHYTLESIDAQGNTLETLYDKDWQPLYVSHPPLLTGTLDKPMKMAGGTRLRQTCTWDNTTTDPVIFPREMCVAFSYYFPDNGNLDCNVEYPPQP